MIGITRLLCGGEFAGDAMRYDKGVSPNSGGSEALAGVAPGRGPVVVWNSTRRCNLRCIHCYADANTPGGEELTSSEAKELIDDLSAFRVPVLLLSGGEPMLRPDFFDLVQYAGNKGLRVTVSTNGTLIDREAAKRLKQAGAGYVGISLDGLAEQNDFFRGQKGAFAAALAGIGYCQEAGQKTGLRLTLSKNNVEQLPDIMRLVEDMDIPRVCFYHLVYAGRGSGLREEDLTGPETRAALDQIMDWVEDMERRGRGREVLTVDNHADAVYLYLRLRTRNPRRADLVLPMLLANGGNRSGTAIGQVDWSGTVHPDQFSANHPLGNVRERAFSAIWSDSTLPMLRMLRDRKKYLQGRCATCRWLDMCNGNFRARAEAAGGDLWQPDPACYLTEEEIGLRDPSGEKRGN